MKKNISLILVLTMLFSVFCTAYAAEEPASKEAEQDYGIYAEAVETLFDLNILAREGFDINAKPARGEFIQAVINMMGIGGALVPENTSFSDVTSEQSFSSAVKAAVDIGIIRGFEDGLFHPERTVSGQQAVKILMSSLGYDITAASLGGYPAGYMAVGYSHNLMKRVTLDENGDCTWGNAAQLIYNALTVDILKDVNTTGKYESVEGENPLTQWLGTSIAQGEVEANEYTSINGSEKVSKGYVKIYGALYSVGNTNITEYLGYSVKAYYTDDGNGNNRILSFRTKNTVSEIIADSQNIGVGTGNGKISYLNDDGSGYKSIATTADTRYIYNGKYAPDGAGRMKIQNGRLRIVDNNSDNRADVVFIEESKNYYIKQTNTSNYSITDKFTDEVVSFEVADNTVDTVFLLDSAAVEFKKMKANNVITVMQSDDKSYTKVYVGEKKVKATIAEINDDTVLMQDGTQFILTTEAKSKMSNLPIGEEKTFYLTYDGKIGGFEIDGGEGKYGYLIAAAILGEGFESKSTVTFRIFGTDGKINNYKNSEKMLVNGIRYNSAQEIVDIFKNGTKFEDQLVRFVANSDGEITKLYRAKKNTGEPFSEDLSEFTLDYYYNYDKDEGVNYGDNEPKTGNYKMLLWAKADDSYGIFSNVVSLKGTVCIKIPMLAKGETLIDREDDIAIVNNVSYFNRTAGVDYRHVYNLRAYDMNGGREPKVMVFVDHLGGGSGTIPATQHVVVDHISQAFDKDGYPASKIYGYTQTGKVSYEIDTESKELKPDDLNLQRGDIIRVATAPKVIRVVKIFTPHKTKPAQEEAPYSENSPQWILYRDIFADWVMRKGSESYIKTSTSWYDEMGVAIHAKAVSVSKNAISIKIDSKNSGLIERVFPVTTNESKFYVYDEATNKLTKGSIGDIDPDNENQSLVMRIQYNLAKEVVIYNWKDGFSARYDGKY